MNSIIKIISLSLLLGAIPCIYGMKQAPRTDKLFIAVTQNNINDVRTLLDNGHASDLYNGALFYKAAASKNAAMLQLLIEHTPISVQIDLLKGEFIEANNTVWFDELDAIYDLNDGTVRFSSSYQDSELNTKEATSELSLLNNQAKAELQKLNTTLRKAAWTGNENLAIDLIDDGANVNAKGPWGDTPLSLAAEKGHYNIVRLLIRAGAEIQRNDGLGYRALENATRNNHHEIAQLLREGLTNHALDKSEDESDLLQ